MTTRGRAILNGAGDLLVFGGFVSLVWGLSIWSQPLALVVGGGGLIGLGILAALK